MPQFLADLEMHELLREIVPDLIKSDDDEFFRMSEDITDNCVVQLTENYEIPLRHLLGKLVFLTPTVWTMLSEKKYHAFVTHSDGRMMAIVKREAGGDT